MSPKQNIDFLCSATILSYIINLNIREAKDKKFLLQKIAKLEGRDDDEDRKRLTQRRRVSRHDSVDQHSSAYHRKAQQATAANNDVYNTQGPPGGVNVVILT